MALERVNLYLAQGAALLAVRPEAAPPAQRLPLDVLGAELWARGRAAALRASRCPASRCPPPTRLFVAGYRYAFPLAVRGPGVGVVLAGFKADHTPLNSEDVELIRHLLDQAALAIENAQLVGQPPGPAPGGDPASSATPRGSSSPRRPASRCSTASAGWSRSTPPSPASPARERAELIGRGLDQALPVQPLPAPGEGPIEVSWCDADGAERHLQLSLAAFDRGWRQGPACWSSTTSPSGWRWRTRCARRTAWRPSACSRPASPTRSTRRSPASRATPRCCWTDTAPRATRTTRS